MLQCNSETQLLDMIEMERSEHIFKRFQATSQGQKPYCVVALEFHLNRHFSNYNVFWFTTEDLHGMKKVPKKKKEWKA